MVPIVLDLWVNNKFGWKRWHKSHFSNRPSVRGDSLQINGWWVLKLNSAQKVEAKKKSASATADKARPLLEKNVLLTKAVFSFFKKWFWFWLHSVALLSFSRQFLLVKVNIFTQEYIARVQNCPDVPILKFLGLCLFCIFVFWPSCLFVFWPLCLFVFLYFCLFFIFVRTSLWSNVWRVSSVKSCSLYQNSKVAVTHSLTHLTDQGQV